MYIFPILEDGVSALNVRYRILSTLKHITEDIREIAAELKIKQAGKITHYWARHTFSTTLKRSGISIAVISEALGTTVRPLPKLTWTSLSKQKLIILLSI